MDVTFPQLVPYCIADRVFFDTPQRIPDNDSLFTVARRPAPTGWDRHEYDLWIGLRPTGAGIPAQGWKVHVSATASNAERVCELVWDFCVSRNITMKFLRSMAALKLANSKYAERSGSGKLITLYPHDERQLTLVLPALAELLSGFTGPYILSDLRYEESPVHVRYGAFVPMTCDDGDGNPVPAIHAPDGQLVPDRRGPVFTVPQWVTIPEVLRASADQRHAGGEGFPYVIERALHFSNGGGVYLARDKDTGQQMVLLEGRPHAGLDADGMDAVGRLKRERATLARLEGLSCVPRLLGYFEVWEHHFLAEEYIEGNTLMEEVFARHPLVGPDPTARSAAAYTHWAMGVLAAVDHALMAVHDRGVRFVDLHPANIIVRPDGRVALVDFEIATDLADDRLPALAAPGFVAPATLSGRAADNYLMDCLRQWVFLPITPLQERDPVKLATLTNVISEHFPVPPEFGARLLRRLRPGTEPLGTDLPAAAFAAQPPDWPAIRDSLVAGIHASATPERADRLFPGDPTLFATGGFTLANGAAGVLYALHQVGATVPDHYVDWLVTAAHQARDPRPGLYDGLHGVAATLDLLGRHDDALDVLNRARKRHDGLWAPGLHGGLAGAGLNLLHFACATGDEELWADALRIGEELARTVRKATPAGQGSSGKTGLLYGLAGAALLFMHFHAATGDAAYLDLAGRALRHDIATGQYLPDGTFQLTEGGSRYLSYFSTGSGGLALVLADYLALRPEPGLAGVVTATRRACGAPFIRHPALFQGRAGAIATLCRLAVPADRPVIDAHVRRLGWHALSYQGHLAFPGNQLLRLSMDLATGAAGVLVALGAAFGGSAAVIPYLDLHSAEVTAPGGGDSYG